MSLNTIDLCKLFNTDTKNISCLLKNDYNVIENQDIFMITKNKKLDILFNNYQSHIFSKKDYKYITSFPKICYINESAKKYLKNNQDIWDEFTIMQSFEGPIVQVFYFNQWIICSETSLDASNIYGSSNRSIREFFNDTGKCGQNELDKLNKDYCYHFVILHNKLKHIVQYSNLGYDYKELALINITLFGSLESNNLVNKSFLDDKIFLKPIIYHFSCLDELEATLDKISYDNVVYKKISTDGFLIKHKNIFLKLHTEIYNQVNKFKPLNKNNYQIYLELYQCDKLNDILPYISKYSNEIIHRINMSMRTLSKEILNIYHITRKKKNSELYESLPDSYKKILFHIHGMYIKGRKKDFINGHEIEGNDIKSITVHDIYYYLKNSPSNYLRQIYFDRIDLMKNIAIIPYLNLNCIYTLTQSRLMNS